MLLALGHGAQRTKGIEKEHKEISPRYDPQGLSTCAMPSVTTPNPMVEKH